MRNELFHQFNTIVQDHNCYFRGYTQYIACKSDRKKGNLFQMKINRHNKIDIEMKKSVWNKITVEYRELLKKEFNAHMALNGYMKLTNIDRLNPLIVILMNALS